MKNKATIIKLIITMISTIVVLVIGACVYKNNINKAKCAHIDENIDMRCDKCDAILLFKDIAQYQEIEEETQRGAKVKVKGNMPQNIKISAQDIAKEQAEQLLKSFNLQIEKEKIYAAYNITLKSKQKKYQPVEYGESVKVDIVDEQIVSDSEMSLLHIINGEEYEIVPLNIKSTNELTFETTSFSTYILINVANYSLKFNDTERYIAYSMRGRELQNEIKVLQNENYTFTIKPKEGYKLENITITSGELIQKGNTFGRTATIKSINTDIEVNVATTETPKITKQPITQKVKSGDTVIYQTEIQNTNGEVAYEWQYRNNGTGSFSKIPDTVGIANENTLTISNVNEDLNGYEIRCLISDQDYKEYNRIITDKALLIVAEGTIEDEYKKLDTSKYMITEWNVSGDAGLTITLPASGTDLNISVDWGDGSADIITTEFPTHTYASAGVYEIKVAGNCPIWGNNSVDTISETSNYYTYTKYLTKVKQFGELNATRYGFANCENLIQVQGENLVLAKTFENVENMAYMFYKCSNLKNIDASKFDTSKVTDMSWMFRQCSSLTSLDLSNFNTSKVTNMSFMFHWCQALTSLNVNNFDTSKVTNMQLMFGYCNNLQTIDVSGFNTSEVTTMRGMFAFCSNLTKLDVSNFDTLKVTDIITMFRSCSNLTSLDISNFNTFNATEIDMAFGMCTNLKTLQLSNKFKIPTSNVVANLFISTPNLTSIIIVDSEPLPEQFTRLVEKLEGKTIYVPNEEAEIAYEEAWSGDFSGDRIQPILELVGDEKTKLSVSEEAYTDAGYTVAGLTEIDSNAYTCYGYNVTSSGEVNRREAGIYKITYQITRTYEKDGQTITTEPYEVTREIEVEALTIEIPTMIGEYTYTGILQTLQLKNLDTSKMEITGNTATNVGSYTATIKIKNKKMYAWKDGTTQDINITWEIKPIIAEITWNITTIEYDGTPKQIVATVSNTVNGESVTVTAYDGTISATDVGEYTAKVKSLSSTNYTLEGALNTEKIWQIKIAVIDMEVIMQDYSYGGTLVNPSITNNEAERNVVYYYSTEDASKGGTDWSTVTNSLSIPVGTYYMYAIVEATQNYQETITDPVMFKVLTTQLQINMTTEDDQYYQNEWTNQSVYIALTQNGGANVTAYQYKIGTSGSWIDQVTLPIVIENTTNDEIKVRGVNPAGRVVTEETSAGVVKIDKTNPTIANETYKHENKILSVVFKLNDGQSGISAYAITPRENMIKEWITSEEGTKQVEVSGSGTYYIWAKDKVGNTAYKTIKVIKDIIPPTAQITVKEAYTTENNKYYVNQNTVTISVDANDNQTSKAQIKMAIYKEADYKAITSEDDIVWETYKLDNEWTVQKENAEEKVYVILKDLAGNITVKVGE